MPDAAPRCSRVCVGITRIAVREALVCTVEASLDGRDTLVGDRDANWFGSAPDVVGVITNLDKTRTHQVSSDEPIGEGCAVAFESDIDLNATNSPVFRAAAHPVTAVASLVSSDAPIFTSDAHLGEREARVATPIHPRDPLMGAQS